MLAAMLFSGARRVEKTAMPFQRMLSIAKRCEGLNGRAEAKKKARRTNDAPSNKTIGNCLLGFHCSQKNPAANRAIARFRVVAGRQQIKLCTSY
jgi:hypothetical protein